MVILCENLPCADEEQQKGNGDKIGRSEIEYNSKNSKWKQAAIIIDFIFPALGEEYTIYAIMKAKCANCRQLPHQDTLCKEWAKQDIGILWYITFQSFIHVWGGSGCAALHVQKIFDIYMFCRSRYQYCFVSLPFSLPLYIYTLSLFFPFLFTSLLAFSPFRREARMLGEGESFPPSPTGWNPAFPEGVYHPTPWFVGTNDVLPSLSVCFMSALFFINNKLSTAVDCVHVVARTIADLFCGNDTQ